MMADPYLCEILLMIVMLQFKDGTRSQGRQGILHPWTSEPYSWLVGEPPRKHQGTMLGQLHVLVSSNWIFFASKHSIYHHVIQFITIEDCQSEVEPVQFVDIVHFVFLVSLFC